MRAGKVGTGLEDGKPRRMEAARGRGGKANGHPKRSRRTSNYFRAQAGLGMTNDE